MYCTPFAIDVPHCNQEETRAFIRAAAAYCAGFLNLLDEHQTPTTSLLMQNLNHLDVACRSDVLRSLSKMRKLHMLLCEKELLANSLCAACNACVHRGGNEDGVVDLLDCMDMPCYYTKDRLCVGVAADRREYVVSAMGEHVQGALHAPLVRWLQRVEQKLCLAALRRGDRDEKVQKLFLSDCQRTSGACKAP